MNEAIVAWPLTDKMEVVDIGKLLSDVPIEMSLRGAYCLIRDATGTDPTNLLVVGMDDEMVATIAIPGNMIEDMEIATQENIFSCTGNKYGQVDRNRDIPCGRRRLRLDEFDFL